MPIFEGGIAGEIRRRKKQRKTDEAQDVMALTLEKAKARPETIEAFRSMKFEDTSKMMGVIADIQKVFSGTPEGQREKTEAAVEKSRAEDISKSISDFGPSITVGAGALSPETPPPFEPPTLTGGDKVKAAQLEVVKGAAGQGAKAAELSGRQGLKATSALDTTMSTLFDFGERQMELTEGAVRPGQFLGVFDHLIPSEANAYKQAFKGSTREAASIVGRQLIPGSRALGIAKMFEKSAAKIGDSIETSANNVAASSMNIFQSELADNIMDFDERTGKKVRIQDITIDPITGRPLSQLGRAAKTKAINALKEEFKVRMRETYIMSAFRRDPNLLQPRTRKEIMAKLPVFKSEAEAEAALAPGDHYIWNGGLMRIDEEGGA
jgi:hypothetical protein